MEILVVLVYVALFAFAGFFPWFFPLLKNGRKNFIRRHNYFAVISALGSVIVGLIFIKSPELWEFAQLLSLDGVVWIAMTYIVIISSIAVVLRNSYLYTKSPDFKS